MSPTHNHADWETCAECLQKGDRRGRIITEIYCTNCGSKAGSVIELDAAPTRYDIYQMEMRRECSRCREDME